LGGILKLLDLAFEFNPFSVLGQGLFGG